MIEDLKPYSGYQPIDSRWIARAPSHWQVKKLRALITPRSDRNRPDLPLLSVARERGVFVRTEDDDNHNFVPDDLSNYKVARQGSLVINKMKAWQGSMGIAPTDGIVSPAYFVYDLRISNRMFGQTLLRSRSYVAHFAQASDGVRVGQWDLSINRMREIPVLLPPSEEQAAIVRFLNHSNRRIDQFIKAKRKLIALLVEQKQEIISRTVMRGIDQSVTLVDSGISWLGAIPKHWRIVRNMALFAHRVEPGFEGLPVFQVSLRTGVTAEQHDQFGRQKKRIADPTKYKRTHQDDVVYNTMRMWQGAVGVSPSDGMVSPAYVVLRPRNCVCPEFYDLVFHAPAYMQQVERFSTGIVSDRNRLYWDSFKQMPNIALPYAEQLELVSCIKSQTREIAESISRIERELDLVREYRTRLISDVVTGQLDVRAAAALLPDIEPETESLEFSSEEDATMDAEEAT